MNMLSLLPHFRNIRDPDYFFESKEHLEALERLKYAVGSEEKLAILTGEIGSGKTFTKTVFKQSLDKDKYHVIDVPDSSMTFNQLLYNIVCMLKNLNLLEKKSYRSNILKKFFEEELVKIAVEDGKYLVVLLDEAQTIGGRQRPSITKIHLEQIRLLTNIDLIDKNLMTIILIGQPELRRLVAELPQLEDRSAPPYHLNAFDLNTTNEYIAFRLKKGGAKSNVFSDEAIKIILGYSKGLPRRITRMCYVCLYLAGTLGMSKIDDKIAHIIYEDFRSGARKWEKDARKHNENSEEEDE